MQAFLSWIYTGGAQQQQPPPQQQQDPPATIGTWRTEEMRYALASGDVSVLSRKAFPYLAAQLQQEAPIKLCTHRNTLPAVEGGLISYLGTLMAMHPRNANVHYMALRLLFCALHSASPQQLATIVKPIMDAMEFFGSSSSATTMNGNTNGQQNNNTAEALRKGGGGIIAEGSLADRTMMAGGGGGGVGGAKGGGGGSNPYAAGGSNAKGYGGAPQQPHQQQQQQAMMEQPAPHVIQEIHLMATAVLCKISFAVSLPPHLATHCADQLLAIAKGNENPKLKRIEEEAAMQHIQRTQQRNATAAAASNKQSQQNVAAIAEIEIYFSNRNREMRLVLSKMVKDAIEGLHTASERFSPTTELLTGDDDGGCETDETMSALFRPKMGEVSRRSLFDAHSSLWLAVLEAVGGDIIPSQRTAAQSVVLAVATNTTRSQRERMAPPLDRDGGTCSVNNNQFSGNFSSSTSNNNNTNGGAAIFDATTGVAYYAAMGADGGMLNTLRPLHAKDTFMFGLPAMVHVAQFLRLGYKCQWLNSTDAQLEVLWGIYARHCRSQKGCGAAAAAAEKDHQPAFDGINGTTAAMAMAIGADQRMIDDLIVAILGALEYILLANNEGNAYSSSSPFKNRRTGGMLNGGGGDEDFIVGDEEDGDEEQGYRFGDEDHPHEYSQRAAAVTDPSLIVSVIEAILEDRAHLLALVGKETTADGSSSAQRGSSNSGGGGVGAVGNDGRNFITTTIVPFAQRSSQIGVVCCNVLKSLTLKADEAAQCYVTPQNSNVQVGRVKKTRAGGGDASSPKSGPSSHSPSPPPPPQHPSLFLRALVLLQCQHLVTYALALQEVLESLWFVIHSGTRLPSSDTERVTRLVSDHYLFTTVLLCKRVPEALARHFTQRPITAAMLGLSGKKNKKTEGSSATTVVGIWGNFFSGFLGGSATNYDPTAVKRHHHSIGGAQSANCSTSDEDYDALTDFVFTGTEVVTLFDINGGHSAPLKADHSEAAANTCANAAGGIAGRVMAFVPRLLHIEPLVAMLCTYPFNLPTVKTLISTSVGGGGGVDPSALLLGANVATVVTASLSPAIALKEHAPMSAQNPTPFPSISIQLRAPAAAAGNTTHSTTAGGLVGPTTINPASALVVTEALIRIVKTIKIMVISAEKPFSSSETAALAKNSSTNGIVSTLAWGLVSAIGSGVVSATNAVVAAASDSANAAKPKSSEEVAAKHALLQQKPVAQQLFLSSGRTIGLVQHWLVTLPLMTLSSSSSPSSVVNTADPSNQSCSAAGSVDHGAIIAIAEAFVDRLVLDTLLDRLTNTRQGLYDGVALQCLHKASRTVVVENGGGDRRGVKERRTSTNNSSSPFRPTSLPAAAHTEQQQLSTAMSSAAVMSPRTTAIVSHHNEQHQQQPLPNTSTTASAAAAVRPLLDVAALPVHHLLHLAALWKRHVGVVYNDYHVLAVEELFLLDAFANRHASCNYGGAATSAATPTTVTRTATATAAPPPHTITTSYSTHYGQPPIALVKRLLSRNDVLIAAAQGLGAAEREALMLLGHRVLRHQRGTPPSPSLCADPLLRDVLMFLPHTSVSNPFVVVTSNNTASNNNSSAVKAATVSAAKAGENGGAARTLSAPASPVSALTSPVDVEDDDDDDTLDMTPAQLLKRLAANI